MVIPDRKHLWELKSIIYEKPYENQVKDYSLDGFELVEAVDIQAAMIKLESHEDIANLFTMTPYYYNTKPEDRHKLDNIDSILTLLENRKDNPKQIVSENKVPEEDKIYESSFAVKNMPDEYRPKWNLASKLVKESIVSKSKLYDFNKEGVLESFWEKVEWEEPKAQINENANSKTISFGGEDWMRQQLRQTGIRLGLRK